VKSQIENQKSKIPDSDQVRIYPNVQLGRDVTLHSPCILGMPPRGKKPGELPLVIGDGAVIRPFSTLYAGTTIGRGFQCGQCVSIREDNVIGDECSIGTCSTIEYGNRIGNEVRIHSGCFLELVTIGNHVLVGPNVVFTDDPHMKCPRYQDCVRGAVVEDLVRIGANTTLLPGVRVGRNSFVGAGSVVTRDVPPDCVVVGCPAEVIKRVDELTCPKGFFKRPYDWPPYTSGTKE